MTNEELALLADELTMEDMPNKDMQDVAKICGLDVARILMKKMSGGTVYIPGSWKDILLKRYVLANYPAKSIRELIEETGYSQNTVYRILREDGRRGFDGQLDMFDEGNDEDDEREGNHRRTAGQGEGDRRTEEDHRGASEKERGTAVPNRRA